MNQYTASHLQAGAMDDGYNVHSLITLWTKCCPIMWPACLQGQFLDLIRSDENVKLHISAVVKFNGCACHITYLQYTKENKNVEIINSGPKMVFYYTALYAARCGQRISGGPASAPLSSPPPPPPTNGFGQFAEAEIHLEAITKWKKLFLNCRIIIIHSVQCLLDT